MLVAAQGPIYARLAEGLQQELSLAGFPCLCQPQPLWTGIMLWLPEVSVGRRRYDTERFPIWVWLGGIFGAVHVWLI